MPKRDTIENRVYLFDSLAGQFVAAAADRLMNDRENALRVLADLAWVSCVVADTGELDAEAVRAKIVTGAGEPTARSPKKQAR